MPGSNRLTGGEIRRARPSKRLQGTLFSLAIAPLKAQTAKCAVVVSKKVALRAHERNLIKRRARAALRDAVKVLPKGFSYQFTAKRSAPEASFEEISADISRLCSTVA